MPAPKTKRVPMESLKPEARRRTFDEVAKGYTLEQAMEEASRCLNCKTMPCVGGCPVQVDIPGFVTVLAGGDVAAAITRVKEKNNLPAICGRVCPQESQCEFRCVYRKKHDPVAIGRLERFVADWELTHGVNLPPKDAATGKRVAVVGSGPAGLTGAADLAKMGHEVVIFEALHRPGGVLVYGIPDFRLPTSIVEAEVDYVQRLGVRIENNVVIGKTLTVGELFEEGFHAVLVSTGAGLPYFLDIPGENLNGVYTANEFLVRTNLMKAYLFPEYLTPIRVGKKVAVVGAGNTAMDAVRCALRLGADEVSIVYRRSEAEMPARVEEVEHAREEGVDFFLLTSPVEFLGDDRGWVTGIKCLRMELGEPDSSGRRRPVAVPGSEFTIEADTVVLAVSQGPNPLVPSTTPGLETGRHGNIAADPETCATSLPGVYAAGDIVSGGATVIEAMGLGKKAAAAIDRFLRAS